MSADEIPPPVPSSSDVEGNAKLFASLVKNMLEEHEKREIQHLQRLTSLVDLLVHDARGLHLQVAAQEASLARVQVTIADLSSRVATLETLVQQLTEPKAT